MYALNLRDTRCRDPFLVGNKAAHLAQLLDVEELTIPPGVVMTTRAYNVHVADIQEDINRLLDTINFDMFSHIEQTSEAIKSLIIQNHVEELLEQEIRQAYTALCEPTQNEYVAVRSSSPDEDTRRCSCAGTYDTILGATAATITEAVVRVMGSTYNTAALCNRHNFRMPLQASLAVLIMPVIPTEFSGVAFTVHPVNSDQATMYIALAPGLAKGLVTGEIPVHEITVEKDTLHIKEQLHALPTREAYLFEHGEVVKRKVRNFRPDTQYIPRIAQACIAVEAYFGIPQNIEFGVYENDVFILQSRPLV
jgi:pyruvate,water dikinase